MTFQLSAQVKVYQFLQAEAAEAFYYYGVLKRSNGKLANQWLDYGLTSDEYATQIAAFTEGQFVLWCYRYPDIAAQLFKAAAAREAVIA